MQLKEIGTVDLKNEWTHISESNVNTKVNCETLKTLEILSELTILVPHCSP